VPTLDGRTLSLSLDEIVTPSSCIKVINEGMPLYHKPQLVKNYLDPIMKGNLYVKFQIIFPQNLTEDQKVRIEKVLQRE